MLLAPCSREPGRRPPLHLPDVPLHLRNRQGGERGARAGVHRGEDSPRCGPTTPRPPAAAPCACTRLAAGGPCSTEDEVGAALVSCWAPPRADHQGGAAEAEGSGRRAGRRGGVEERAEDRRCARRARCARCALTSLPRPPFCCTSCVFPCPLGTLRLGRERRRPVVVGGAGRAWRGSSRGPCWL